MNMSSLRLFNNLSRSISLLAQRIAVTSIGSTPNKLSLWAPQHWFIPAAAMHTTTPRMDLMEFFDDKDNWGKNEVRSGRAWTADELRLKSNTDLHKLWFVLLKERNMLMTMEHECDHKYEVFPSPERVDKVQISMGNIETVVRERNRAYYQLETGTDGERPGKVVHNILGLTKFYRMKEHFIPKHAHPKFRDRFFSYNHRENEPYLKLWREKCYNVRRKQKNRDRNEVTHILRRWPNVSHEVLAKKYPDVNLAKILRDDKARGHFAPKI